MSGPSSIVIDLLEIGLRVRQGGRVPEGIGPAFQGMIGRPLREAVCVVNPIPETCDGCAHLRDCAYGATFRDLLKDEGSPPGWRDAPRPLVAMPYFPLPEILAAGDEVGVLIKQVRHGSSLALDLLLRVIHESGRARGLGGGPRPVLFEVVLPAHNLAAWKLTDGDLPKSAGPDQGRVPAIRITTRTPLIIHERDRSPEPPEIGRLLGAATRVVSRHFRAFAQPLGTDFPALKRAAETVVDKRVLTHSVWSQIRSRSRVVQGSKGRSFPLSGWMGEVVYEGVPCGLLPWLVWGGRLHVGRSRKDGFGAFDVALE